MSSNTLDLLERIPENGYYLFLNLKTGAPYQLYEFYYLHKRILRQAGCRGWPFGTCSASAWRWGYDAERLCSPLIGVYDKNQSRPTTCAAHNYIFRNHILPGLGDIPLSELTVEWVGDFLKERKCFSGHRPESSEYPGLGEHTMRHIHRLLQQCLDQAIRDGLIAENPTRAFHYPKPKKVSANVLTPAEVEDYLDAAERLGHPSMFLLVLTAGYWQGELIALMWSDLDAKERMLTINEKRSVERRKLVEYGDNTRTISLTEEVVEFLRSGTRKAPRQSAHVYAPGHTKALLTADGTPTA